MHRDIPMFNRPIMVKIYKQNQQRHIQRLRKIKNNNPNKNMLSTSHSLCNKKSVLHQQLQKTQIQKQNVILFNKMTRIMNRNDPLNRPIHSHTSYKPRTTVTNFSKITQQNRALFERLQNQRPTINNKKLKQDRLKNLNILKFLGKYPKVNPQKYFSRFQQQRRILQTQGQQKQQMQLYYDEQFENCRQQIRNIKTRENQRSVHSSNYNRSKIQSQHQNHRQRIIQTSNQSYDPSKLQYSKIKNPVINLYSCKVIIDGVCMQINILRHYNQYQISAVQIQGIQQYKVSIPQDEGNLFFQQYDYNYKKISQMLAIQDKKLVIDTTKLVPTGRKIQQPKQIIHELHNQDQNRDLYQKQAEPEDFMLQFGNYQQALQQSLQ